MKNLPNGITYLNEIPLSDTVFLDKVSDGLGLPLKRLVAEICKLNDENKPINLFAQVREHSIEVDKWSIESGKKKPQSFSEDYYNGKKVLKIHEQPSGLLKLNQHHKTLLANKKSIQVVYIWSDEKDYVRTTSPIGVQRKNLLISMDDASRVTDILKNQHSPITDKKLIQHVNDTYAGDAAQLLRELDTLKRDNQLLKRQLENLKDHKTSNGPKNREKLYAIIAGLTQKFVPNTSPYIKDDGTPNFSEVARKVITVVTDNDKEISGETSVRGIITEAMEDNGFYTPPKK